MLLIDAVYIHESGGKTLLLYLIDELVKEKISFLLLLDKRLDVSCTVIESVPTDKRLQVIASEKNRRLQYRKLNNEISRVLCLANVPPPYAIQKEVYVFFQNRLLISGIGNKTRYSIWQKIKTRIKWLYIRAQDRKNYQWIVQTKSMKNALMSALQGADDRIYMLPFYDSKECTQLRHIPKIKNSFIYPADGVPQKNHKILFDAWGLLGKQYNYFPQLHITITNKYSELIELVQYFAQQGIKIINHGYLHQDQLHKLYSETEYLIFPSLVESFGLPLVEAAKHGCGILASDLPYVYEMLTPTKVFNPYDARSIAEACLQVKDQLTEPAKIIVQNQIAEMVALLKKN